METVLAVDSATGLAYRPGLFDLPIIREQVSYLRLDIQPADTVLDVGGHIGAFAAYALTRGATVTVVEPAPDNLELLLRNVGSRCEVVPAAVVSDGSASARLYLNGRANRATHTLVPTRGRVVVDVPTVDFQALLARVQPTVLKVDVEGGEYALDWDLPPCVDRLAVELHRTKPGHKQLATALAARIEAQGFDRVKAPVLEGGGWATLGIWRRP